jgi:hypothetical protein
MLIEISIGEGLDRLSILEIKERELADPGRLVEVRKEITSLGALQPYKERFVYYYNLILFVNKTIWDLTNTIKRLSFNEAGYGEIAHNIFEFNQSRFRLKNIVNILSESSLREQKSYAVAKKVVCVEETVEDLILLRNLTYLSLVYDAVCIRTTQAGRQRIERIIPPFQYTFDCVSEEGVESLEDIRVPALFKDLPV